jgi:hypothetical protein
MSVRSTVGRGVSNMLSWSLILGLVTSSSAQTPTPTPAPSNSPDVEGALRDWEKGCAAIRSYDVFLRAETKTLLDPKDWSPRKTPLTDKEVSHQIFRSGKRRIELGVTRPSDVAIETFVWDGSVAKRHFAQANDLILDPTASSKPGGLDYEAWYKAPSSMTYTDILRERPKTTLEKEGDQSILYTPPLTGQFELAPLGLRVWLDRTKGSLPSRIEYLLVVLDREVVSTRLDITLEEVAKGVWAPVKLVTAGFPPIIQTRVPPRKSVESVSALDRDLSKFNPDVPDSLFRLAPQGARVVDRTGERWAAELFAGSPEQRDRIFTAIEDARLSKAHVLLMLGMPEDRASHQLAKLRHDVFDSTGEFRTKLQGFRVLGINAKDPATAKAFAALDIAVETSGTPALVVLNADGKVVGDQSFAPEMKGGKIDRKAIEAFLEEHEPSKMDAERLLGAALEQARRENKRVYIQETSMSCAPCLSMARFLNRHKAIIDQDFIVLKIFRERYANGDKVLSTIRKDNSGGIPWVAILDGEGKVLATSHAEGINIGFPYDAAGVEHFLKMLSSTAKRITPEQMQQLRKSLEERAKSAPKLREPATELGH